MSWPNKTGQPNSGGNYVYQKEKSFSQRCLRLLGIEEGLGGSNPSQALLQFKECSQYELILHSLSLHWALFKEQPFENMPLWLILLRSNQSARIFSADYRSSIDNYFDKFSLPISSKLLNHVDDFQELYNLGQHDKIQGRFYAPAKLKLRLELLNGEITQEDLAEKVACWKPDYLEEKLFWGFYFARMAQRKSNIDLDQAKSLLALDYSKIRREYLHKTVQVLNSLNLIHFFRGDFSECDKIFLEEERLIPQIPNNLIREHLIGNLNFHKAMVSKATGDEKSELDYLQKALKYDHGYHDYFYRIASLYHDQGSPLAKDYYENALKVSPWYQSLINDYGILLCDMGLEREFEDLKVIAEFLFPEELVDG